MTTEPLPVFTIGHSTRTIAQFVDLLRAGDVAQVVDIRTVPRSRTNPQYNLDVLPGELAPYQIGYLRIAELGGLRGRQTGIQPDINALWTNQSFHNYADYALSGIFRSGLKQLLDVAADRRTAIMCSEAVWWRCHRRLVADYLMQGGRTVYNLMGKDAVQIASVTPGAIYADDGIHYPVR